MSPTGAEQGGADSTSAVEKPPSGKEGGAKRGLRTFRANLKWQFVCSIGVAALSALLLVIMGRVLGATEFGVFSVVVGMVTVANALFEPRMQDVAAKHFWNLHAEAEHDHGSYLVDFVLFEIVGKLLPCIALIALSPILARISHLPPDGVTLIIVAATGVYLSKLGNGLSIGLLRVMGRSDLYAFCTIGEFAIRIVVTLVLVFFFKLTVISCIILMVCAGIVSNCLLWIFTIRELKLPIRFRLWKIDKARGRLSENRKLLLANIGLSATDLMSKDLDVTLIAPFLPADHVGIYKMAKNIAWLAWRAVDPFTLSLMPEVNRLFSLRAYPQLNSLLLKSSAFLLLMVLCLTSGAYWALVLFGQAILGPDFSNVAGLVVCIMVGVVVSAPLVWGHALSVALDRPGIALAGSTLGAIVGFITIPLLTFRIGVYGAAVGSTLSLSLNMIFIAVVSYNGLRARERMTR
jgi:O-antigen/teichoic acid export membrane protein